MQTIGTCSNCGGPVQVPEFWGGDIPPAARCGQCGATAKQSYGPTIPMNPAPTYPKGYTPLVPDEPGV